MEQMIARLMNHPYWDLMRLTVNGNAHIARFSRSGQREKNAFVSLVMHGFYPLSAAVKIAWEGVLKSAPSDEIAKTAKFFIEVEDGEHARAEWFKGVPHLQLYQQLFDTLCTTPDPVDQALVDRYLGALDLPGGGLERNVVASSFIEKTGLQVLHLLHDFVAQWQTSNGVASHRVDLTYLNEHMLLERDDSDDQHVPMVNALLAGLPSVDLDAESKRFEEITSDFWSHIVARVDALIPAAGRSPIVGGERQQNSLRSSPQPQA